MVVCVAFCDRVSEGDWGHLGVVATFRGQCPILANVYSLFSWKMKKKLLLSFPHPVFCPKLPPCSSGRFVNRTLLFDLGLGRYLRPRRNLGMCNAQNWNRYFCFGQSCKPIPILVCIQFLMLYRCWIAVEKLMHAASHTVLQVPFTLRNIISQVGTTFLEHNNALSDLFVLKLPHAAETDHWKNRWFSNPRPFLIIWVLETNNNTRNENGNFNLAFRFLDHNNNFITVNALDLRRFHIRFVSKHQRQSILHLWNRHAWSKQRSNSENKLTSWWLRNLRSARCRWGDIPTKKQGGWSQQISLASGKQENYDASLLQLY